MKNYRIFFVLILFSTILSAQDVEKSDNPNNSYPKEWKLIIKNGYYGFIGLDGKEIVKPKYSRIDSFGEYQSGWAKVMKNGYYGFIDLNGIEVIKPEFDLIEPFGIYETDWALVMKDGLFGFISIDGKIVVKPKYEYIENLKSDLKLTKKLDPEETTAE